MTVPRLLVRADTGDAGYRKQVVESALESGICGVILEDGDTALSRLGRLTVLFRRNTDLFLSGEKVGSIYRITSAADLDAVPDTDEIAVIETTGWKVIPLENILARLKHTRVYAQVSSAEDAALVSEILETGCAGMVVSADPAEIPAFAAEQQMPPIGMIEATVTAIEPIPLSDRVCIDTTSLLGPEEGMLIGSSSSCLFQVCSENHTGDYAAARPFRVNAGAVHSYILLPDEKTGYLSELAAGRRLLVRSADGAVRQVSAGRIKIERRPMLMIAVSAADGTAGSVVVQNAETIRLLTPEGAVSVADLEVGSRVFVRTSSGGRHFGTAIDETIREL